MSAWVEDVLGAGYEQRTIDLGSDPDGEGEIVATLVRATRAESPPTARDPRQGGPRRAFLWVHGFSDYFFQTELADFFTERGYAFYALDLRKCGRSRRPGHTPHYVSDLAFYDAELDAALEIVREDLGGGAGPRAADGTGGLDVVLGAHSTGGLILPLWLARRGAAELGVTGLVLDSPWFDLQGAPWMRSIGTHVIRAAARVRPFDKLPLPPGDAYGASLHTSGAGEWEYELDWKPLTGFPVTFGWLNAVRRGHAALHRGLDLGIPSLVLRSDKTWFARKHGPRTDVSDGVLDVKQIARWAGCLGGSVTSLPVAGARHDVFLSQPEARAAAYAAIDRWFAFHAMD